MYHSLHITNESPSALQDVQAMIHTTPTSPTKVGDVLGPTEESTTTKDDPSRM